MKSVKLILSSTILGLSFNAHAAPVSIDFTATLQDVSGAFTSDLSIGQSMSGIYIYDTDEANASSAETTPSTVPGHEFTSFYDFGDPAYSASLNAGGFTFTNTAAVSVVVNDNLFLTSDETGGLLPDGSYDWIEILGSTTVDVGGAEHTPGNGQEWTLAIFAENDNWFSDGSVIPDDMPASYVALLVGFDFDENGNEIGMAFATLDSMNISTVPVPAAIWLFGSGLLGLVGVARGKKVA